MSMLAKISKVIDNFVYMHKDIFKQAMSSESAEVVIFYDDFEELLKIRTLEDYKEI